MMGALKWGGWSGGLKVRLTEGRGSLRTRQTRWLSRLRRRRAQVVHQACSSSPAVVRAALLWWAARSGRSRQANHPQSLQRSLRQVRLRPAGTFDCPHLAASCIPLVGGRSDGHRAPSMVPVGRRELVRRQRRKKYRFLRQRSPGAQRPRRAPTSRSDARPA